MEHCIELQATPITYKLLVSARAKRVRITIKRDGSILVTTPRRTPQYFVNTFLQEKAAWIVRALQEVKENPVVTQEAHTEEQIRAYKKETLCIVTEYLKHYNEHYGFLYNAISIRNQKTRWGSCSKKGNLQFSYKIALLPRHLAEYIVVHELCHLGEFNHSPSFWNLVAETIPLYKQAKKELQAYSLSL